MRVKVGKSGISPVWTYQITESLAGSILQSVSVILAIGAAAEIPSLQLTNKSGDRVGLWTTANSFTAGTGTALLTYSNTGDTYLSGAGTPVEVMGVSIPEIVLEEGDNLFMTFSAPATSSMSGEAVISLIAPLAC